MKITHFQDLHIDNRNIMKTVYLDDKCPIGHKDHRENCASLVNYMRWTSGIGQGELWACQLSPSEGCYWE